MTIPSPLALSLYSIVIFVLMAAIAPFCRSRQRFLVNITFAFCALACAASLAAGFTAVSGGTVETLILPIGLPDLPFYLRIDALSGFFITVISLLGLFISIYSIGYVRGFVGHRPITALCVFYPLFMAGMLLVVIADDAYSFMIAWELMAASSFFLVLFEDESGANRRAAFIYLLVAHIGAVMILLSFGLMAGFASGFENFQGYTFSSMRGSYISPGWATAAFLLAFFGFAAKAGVIPLHVWLPEAHPAAPSNVSALMSGVMLKTAIYGIIRLTFDILTVSQWWWGGIVLVLGLISAVMGIIYALMQVDLKRALAYSSVENVGIILISVGLSMIFTANRMFELAALALLAGLYHTLNHAMFKGLLFMGAGAVLHATHERNMERLGGLIHRMPWTSTLFLIGCLSISAMPPFNGFVSEWLTFQAFLLSPVLPNPILKLLFPLGAALLALTAALSARCFVKIFSVTFLGHWRGEHPSGVIPPCAAHEVNWPMRIGMLMAAAACLFLGVFPTLVLGWADMVPLFLTGGKISVSAQASPLGWIWLTPVSATRASYSAPIVFIGIVAVVAAAYAVFHSRKTALTRVPIWDCGFEKLTNRMQYNSTSFAMPLRRIFGFLLKIKESVTPQDPNAPASFQKRFVYRLTIKDRFWYIFYKPFSDASFWCARKAGMMQHGRIQIYLLYSFITLIALLVFA